MALTALALAVALALQPVGTFHEEDTVARDGEHWLALRATPAGTVLVDTRVRVTRVHDEVVDAEGQRTGREVATAVPGVAMLLRGNGLRTGPVASVAVADDAARLGETPVDLRLHGTAYTLAVRCRTGATQCDVVLDDGRRRQALFTLTAVRNDDGSTMLGDDASPMLLFAGDLDRDGRLDLILDTTDHYNVSRPTLFLSSKAARGELVHPAAVHTSVGC